MAPIRRVQDWRDTFSVTKPGEPEVIGRTYYSRKTIVSATTTQLTFFDNTNAAGTGPATLLDSNLKLPKQMPANTYFRMLSIRVALLVQPQAIAAPAGAVDPVTGAINDLWIFYTSGVLTLSILNKPYAEYPLLTLPPGVGFSHTAISAGAAGSLASVATWGDPSLRSVFTLAVPLVLPPNTPFDTSIVFPGGAVTLAGGNTDVYVLLDGQEMRPTQ